MATLVVIVLAWLAVCVVAMLTGHVDALPGIGAVLVDLIDRLVTQPVHDLGHRVLLGEVDEVAALFLGCIDLLDQGIDQGLTPASKMRARSWPVM